MEERARAEAQADADFHLSIYEACHNMTILHVMRGMSGLLRNDVIQQPRAAASGGPAITR